MGPKQDAKSKFWCESLGWVTIRSTKQPHDGTDKSAEDSAAAKSARGNGHLVAPDQWPLLTYVALAGLVSWISFKLEASTMDGGMTRTPYEHDRSMARSQSTKTLYKVAFCGISDRMVALKCP